MVPLCCPGQVIVAGRFDSIRRAHPSRGVGRGRVWTSQGGPRVYRVSGAAPTKVRIADANSAGASDGAKCPTPSRMTCDRVQPLVEPGWPAEGLRHDAAPADGTIFSVIVLVSPEHVCELRKSTSSRSTASAGACNHHERRGRDLNPRTRFPKSTH